MSMFIFFLFIPYSTENFKVYYPQHNNINDHNLLLNAIFTAINDIKFILLIYFVPIKKKNNNNERKEERKSKDRIEENKKEKKRNTQKIFPKGNNLHNFTIRKNSKYRH